MHMVTKTYQLRDGEKLTEFYNGIDYDLDDGDRIMVDDSLYDAALDAFDEYDIEYEEV